MTTADWTPTLGGTSSSSISASGDTSTSADTSIPGDADPGAADRVHLREAIELGRRGMHGREGGPFGAVLVRPGADGGHDKVVARGWNRVTSAADPTAHAEMVALRRAGKVIGAFEFPGLVMYASGEPCPMCWAACRWARLERIVYANGRAQAAEIGFDDQFLYDELAAGPDAQAVPVEQVAMPEGRDLYAEWVADDSYTRY